MAKLPEDILADVEESRDALIEVHGEDVYNRIIQGGYGPMEILGFIQKANGG